MKTMLKIKDKWGPLFKKSFGVPIDDLFYGEDGFDFEEFMGLLVEKYPDWLEYNSPGELEEAKLGPKVRHMMDELGICYPDFEENYPGEAAEHGIDL
jgi:hypothetical protein